MSNTTIGPGEKGSKFWIQTLVNENGGEKLNQAIQKMDSSAKNIVWLSPLNTGIKPYSEMKTPAIPFSVPVSFSFWPSNGPWWDAVGTYSDGGILLVEAKAHVRETETHCTATSPASRMLICKSMKEAHDALTQGNKFDEEIWLNTYYQLANRLAFLYHLRKQGAEVKLLLLNIANDTTHIPTTVDEWDKHYAQVFTALLGSEKAPDDVLVISQVF